MINRKLTSFKFQRNAVLYLKSIAMRSLAQGAYGVIQGLYIMSLGFDETVLGTVLSIRMLATAIASVPAGIVSDNRGRKPVLVVGGVLTTIGYLGMALSSSSLNLIFCSCIVGIAQACQMTSGAPFLAESSTPQERASLFGVNFSLSNFVNMVGSLLGGVLPRQFGWLGEIMAFRVSLALISAVILIGVIPIYRVKEEIGHTGEWRQNVLEECHDSSGGAVAKENNAKKAQETKDSGVFQIVWREIQSVINVMRNKDVARLLVYSVIIGFGAGLIVPFFNVFLSGKLQLDTAVVGLILSLSHGATALAGLAAPVLASKYGKANTVVGTKLASIPFLFLIALPSNVYVVSVALFMRSALMNMSSPVASNISMEIVEPNERGKISSLMRISDNVSRALSTMAAGYIMSRWNYQAPYFITAILYFIASVVYWKAFGGRERE